MIRRHIHEFSNIEFDWLACDADGFVARFSSAGFGAVPEGWDAIVDDIDAALDRINALPSVGDTKSARSTIATDEWFVAAQRGLFAFDWNHGKDRYEIEVSPGRPVHLDEIADDVLRDMAQRVRIPIQFSRLLWITWDEAGGLSFGREP